ncbi:plasmid maintenance protein CcdB (plasmid) [Serratia marcescens]|nr:plasmid maintenance protein CcdB [Serratia marcescens]
MQFKVYGDAGKSTLYPLLLDIIGQLNRRVVIPLLPVEKYPAGQRPDRLIPLIRLTDGNASIPVRTLGGSAIPYTDNSCNRFSF